MDELDNFEETGKRKRFTLLQKPEPALRQNGRHFMQQEDDDDVGVDDSMYLEEFSTVEYKDESRDDNGPPPKKTTRGRPKKKQESLDWSDEATEALIELWKTKGELFNKAHPHFYARDMKDKAVEDIRLSLHERGFDVTTNQVLSKFQSLRTYFCSQRTKLSQSKKYGNVHDDVECKWRFFKSLHFLDDNMKVREGYNHKRRYDGDSPYYRSMVVKEDLGLSRDYSDSAFSPGSDISSRPQESSSLDYIKTSARVDMKTDDHLFGELVGNMVHQLPPGQQKDLLKLEIQQMIIKAKYSTNFTDPSCQGSSNSNGC